MKRLIFAGLVCAAAFGAVDASASKPKPFPPECIAVLCAPCPEGTEPAPRPKDCCRCK